MILQAQITDTDRETLSRMQVDFNSLLDDNCDYSKVVVRKPWGYEYLIFANQMVAVWILYLKPGAQTSMHCHPSKKTALIVLEGKVKSSTLTQDIERSASDGLLIGKAVFHQTTAISPGGAYVMEIETPVNKRDLVRLRDAYGREGQGYEGSDKHSYNTQNYNYLSLIGPEVHYNLKKKFGECTLSFKKINDARIGVEFDGMHDEDVVSVLRGKLCDEKEQVLAEVGDTFTFATLKKFEQPRIVEPLELLLVKRIDHVVRASDILVGFFKDRGVHEVFLVPGDANVHLLDSIGRDETIRFVATQLEHGASLAAEAYSKTSNKVAFLIISSGGSGPNAINAVANSWIDSCPLFVISGQARSDQYSDSRVRQLGNKSLNITDIVRPITKYAVCVDDVSTLRQHLDQAAHLATSGRPGPVWVDIPIDIQGMAVDESEQKKFAPATVQLEQKSVLDSQVKQVRCLLSECTRPVILAGSGIGMAEARNAFLALLERLQIPVLTSRRGVDLIEEEHPLFFGRPGTFGQRRANFIIQNCDLLLSIGSRLSIPLIGRNTKLFARAAKKIIVDIDAAELKKTTINPFISIQADALDFIKALSSHIKDFIPQYASWMQRCRKWATDYPPLHEGYAHGSGINPYLFISDLSSQLSEQSCLVIDGGAVMHCAMQVFKVKSKQRIISSTGLELPGFAISGSIGACFAQQRRAVICLCEDRGFQMGIQELQTIVDNKLPIVVFVLKSKGHSAVRNIQKDFFGGRFVGTDNEMRFGSPDLKQVCNAYGLKSFEIRKSNDVPAQILKVLAAGGPAVCEVEVDSEQELIPRMGFVVKDDGKWIAKPLEDMYPFLSKSKLEEEMLIDLVPEE